MVAHALETPKSNSARSIGRVLLPILIIIAGVLVLVYPVISTQWNNVRQTEVAEQYSKIIDKKPEEVRDSQLVAAEEYNRVHTDGPILDPWLSRVSQDNAAYQEYLSQLDGAPAMSQLAIPGINVNLPVFHGSDMKTLDKGIGHLYGSALPVGGEGTHAVLTGHTGLTNATLFDNLIDVKEGEAIFLNTFGKRMKYEIDQIKIVLPHETGDLARDPNRDLVTLITCTPYGSNTHRLLVRAVRVPMDEQEAQEAFETSASVTWQWWMVAALVAAALVLLLLVWWALRTVRRGAVRNESSPKEQ